MIKLNLLKYLSLTAISMLLWSCEQNIAQEKTSEKKAATTTFPERAKDMTIYEVNIRQYTPEGTFNAFSKHLEQIKKLGAEILWFMPIQPIGEKNRKGTLGSYYSIKDYRAVNEEFGTMQDFKNLVDKAHEMGFVVILDWVPNHTAWDNSWIQSHPEYYAKDSLGNITHEADWTDIALLDHTKPETRKAMIREMKFWIDEVNIDGFRCDHAGHEIPLYFWEEAADELNPLKDLFWLAEWDQPRMHLVFHATYSWELLHLTEAVAHKEEPAEVLNTFIQKDLAEYGKKAFRLTMITNHDENAWSGTVFERYGKGHKAFAAFIFTAYGIPMIYGGQEVGLNKRLAFFEKDSINREDTNELYPFYQKLVNLRKDNPALWSGKYGAMPVILEDGNDNVVSFSRTQDNNKVEVIINLTDQAQTIQISEEMSGTFNNYITSDTYDLNKGPLKLDPYQYFILIK